MDGIVTTARGTIRIVYEDDPVVDGSVADVFLDGREVSSMIYSEDLDQWNDCLNPGDVAAKTDIQCAMEMVEYYNK